MEYTIQRLALLAGLSTRTLRYYDEIDLLKPARMSSSGYRIYSQPEVDRLQHILFYRELGYSLEEIREAMDSPDYDEVAALSNHRQKLLLQREQLEQLIRNVEKTILTKERGIIMSNQEKFEGFKQKVVEENERKYGIEIREKYGNEAINSSNEKLLKSTKEQFAEADKLGEELLDTLYHAFKTGDPACELAQKTAEMHRQWLSYYWDDYSKEAHEGVVRMYVDDERFRAYYDKKQPGLAKFLHDSVLIYLTR